MALIGYMRVSKADGSQTTDLQRDALIKAGVDPDHMYEDKASGKKEDRPELASCLKALRAADTLLVWKLDRLGRNLRHLVNIVHDLTARGVGDGIGGDVGIFGACGSGPAIPVFPMLKTVEQMSCGSSFSEQMRFNGTLAQASWENPC